MTNSSSLIFKLPVVCYQLGEFCPHIASFWLAYVGRNQSINTKFTKLKTAISIPTYIPLTACEKKAVETSEKHILWNL